MKEINSVLTAMLVVNSGFLIKLSTGGQTKADVQGKRMVRATYCPNKVLKNSYRYRTVQDSSKLQCLGQCQQDSKCRAFVYNSSSRRCQLGSTKAAKDCSNMQSASAALSFYQESPPCKSGEELGIMGLCICAPGFTGNPCERYFHDCQDIFEYGNWSKDGIYTVRPLLSDPPFKVFCRRITSTRTYILDRRKTTESFNRPYIDYRDGFGELDEDYWLGLEKVHALTADRLQQLRVNVKIYDNTNYIRIYDQFWVTDEASGYRLMFNVSMLNRTNDCLEPLVNAKFSTYDNDRDKVSGYNCARERKCGFWFSGKGCSECNPFGILYQPPNGVKNGSKDEAFWTEIVGNKAVFKVSMYLLPYIT